MILPIRKKDCEEKLGWLKKMVVAVVISGKVI